MRTYRAATLSALFFIAAPGTVAGLIPWWITGWEFHEPLPYWVVARVTGVILIIAGVVPAASAFVEFVKAGGTPIPLAPTQRLVVSGFNRYIRNPMYFGLIVAILGQALLFGSLALVWYALIAWAICAGFVLVYEEPTLVRTYGAEYESYRRNVPAWWPRLRPWTAA